MVHLFAVDIANLVWWIVFGLVAGALAKWIMPGKGPGGIVVTILLGVGGALVGGFIAHQLNLGPVDGFNIHSLLIAIGGACLLLFGYGLLQRRM